MSIRADNQSRLEAICARLRELGQGHVLRYADELADAELSQLLNSLNPTTLQQVKTFKQHLASKADAPAPAEPHDFLELETSEFPYALHQKAEEAASLGRELLSQGKVAALVVAGGEGTRLGFDRPKGFFPIYPLSKRCLFDGFAAQLRVLQERHGQTIPWYTQTSDATHDATTAGFEEHEHFGLDPQQLFFFKQGSAPALDADGQLMLASPHQVVQSPDGHGGCIDALRVSGALEDMNQRGIEWIYYFQVDNGMERVCDPYLIGSTAKQNAEVGVKVVRKQEPEEKVGVLGVRDGKACVVEYSELNQEQATQREADGRLSFCAGNTAIHVFKRSFLERVANEGDGLPWHAAHKKVASLNHEGSLTNPQEPNAYKFERFIFDTFPLAQKLVALEVPRRRDFVPLKDATGPRSAPGVQKEMQAEWAAWLAQHGHNVANSDQLEIAPELWANPERLLEVASKQLKGASNDQLLLDDSA